VVQLLFPPARLLPRDVVMNTPVRVTTAAELGNALRSHRKKQQIRQQDLADYALLSPKFLSQLENGKETAELGKVLKALELAGLNVWIADRNWSLGQS
jgi:HTH-type transcriptional regulator/antitoxin HipB